MDLLDLFAKISIDSSEYEKGIDEASSKAETFSKGLKTAMKVGAAGVAAVTGATVALGKSLVDGASKTAAFGDNIDKASQKLGLSAEAYQEWDAVLQHSGTSMDAMTTGMRTLANAAAEGSAAFEELGISTEEAAAMSREDLFEATITGLQNLEDENKRAQLAQDLLGRSAMELGALLNTSSKDTDAMRKRVHELGGVMSDDAVKASAAFQDTLQDLNTAISGMKNGVSADFMPAITDVMSGLTDIFSGDPDSGIAKITSGVDSVVQNLTDKLPEFLDLGIGIVDALLQALIDNLPKMLSAGGKLVGEIIAGLIKAIPDLIKNAPEIVKGIIEGLVSAWPDIKDAGADLIDMVWEGIKTVIDNAKKWGSDLIQNFIDGIKQKWADLKQSVSDTASKIKSYLGFSEPEEGPLSDFHTYAPDMMKLFAKGIKDNERVITDQLSKSFDFGNITTESAPKAAGAGNALVAAPRPVEVVINLTSELDGAVLARKTYRYFAGEGQRLGANLVDAIGG